MVYFLFIARIIAVAGMIYALRKGRKDWVRILFVTSSLLAFVGYSLDKSWTLAVL